MSRDTFDPRLDLPPVEGYEYDENPSIPPMPVETPPIEFTLPIGLQPPTSITIIDQVVRQGPGGRDVVDLIIEVEDMPGATEYEVRVAQ